MRAKPFIPELISKANIRKTPGEEVFLSKTLILKNESLKNRAHSALYDAFSLPHSLNYISLFLKCYPAYYIFPINRKGRFHQRDALIFPRICGKTMLPLLTILTFLSVLLFFPYPKFSECLVFLIGNLEVVYVSILYYNMASSF